MNLDSFNWITKYKYWRFLNKNKKKSTNGKNILFWSVHGMPPLIHIEAALGMGLLLGGHDVQYIIADEVIPAYIARDVQDNRPINALPTYLKKQNKLCRRLLNQFCLQNRTVSEFISFKEVAMLRKKLKHRIIDCISEELVNAARASTTRYLKGKDVDNKNDILNEFKLTSLVCDIVAKEIIKRYHPERIVLSNINYAEWRPFFLRAIEAGIPVIGYSMGYLPGHIYLQSTKCRSLDFRSISREAWLKIKNGNSKTRKRKQLTLFLNNRYSIKYAYSRKKMAKYISPEKVKSKIGINKDKIPVWGLFLHVSWDPVFHYIPMVFENFYQWAFETIDFASKFKKVQWIIKIHPGETWNDTNEGMREKISTKFSNLPPHIKILPANSDINTLSLLEAINGIITVYGTVGLEGAIKGIPVILAGKPHYSGKGFTIDSSSRRKYFDNLRNVTNIKFLSSKQIVLAEKYAYNYFKKRQLPINVLKIEKDDWGTIDEEKLHMLVPCKDRILDMISNKIIRGEKDFFDNV